MSDDDWIIVPNWEEFQHYSDRDPTWIKVYHRLLTKPEFIELTLAERGLLLGVWLLYAASAGQLQVKNVGSLYTCSTRHQQWESLNHAGLVAFSASRPLALARSREQEKSREEKNARTREGKPEEQKHAAGVPAAAAYKPFENTTAPPRMDALPDLIAGWLSGNGTVNLHAPDQEAAVITETPEPEPTEPEPDEGGDEEDE